MYQKINDYVLHLIRNVSTKLTGYDLWNARGSLKAVLTGLTMVGILSVIGAWLSRKSKDMPILQKCVRWMGL